MNSEKKNTPYWHWLPAAAALAGIMLYIFATHGPPASSSGYVSAVKGMSGAISEDYIESKQHYQALPGPGSWLMTFVLGMALGGFIGGLSKRFSTEDVPPIWRRRFGPSRARRYAASFAGGFLILFGARLAGGCTLGLFMSGSTQLAISGLYFGIVIFGCAMLTAHLLYGKTKQEELDHD